MRDVVIHGAHGEAFRLEVDNAAEAVRAIIALRPGLRAHFRAHDWRVIVGPLEAGYHLAADELHGNAGRQAIHFVPELAVAGGRGMAIGKIIIGAVLIAAAVFAPVALGLAAGGTLAAIGITQSVVVGLGISMIAGGTAMLLAPTPKAPRVTEFANPEDRPSFFFGGAVNMSEQGVPIPLAYGRFRVGSIVVNAGIWNEDLSPEEVAAGAFGPVLEAPPSYLHVEPPDAELRLLQLAKGGGKGGTPGAAYAPREAPNTLRSRSVVRLHEILCEGPIKGWPTAHWGQSVFLDGTPVVALDGTFNFRVMSAWFAAGNPVETPPPGFPAAESTISIGAEMTHAAPVVRTVASPDATYIRVNIRIPRLFYQHPNGDVLATGVDFTIEYRVGLDPWVLVTGSYIRVLGKTTTGYERTFGFWIPPRDGRDVEIRCTRLSADEVDPGEAYNETFWSSMVEVVEGNIRHDNVAQFAMSVDAEQFPSIPKRAYEFDWLLVRVPTNLDEATGAYVGDWDGTFKWAWSNDPAWVLYDLMVDPLRGIGRDLNIDTVDRWSFYEAARYNSERVSDGRGGDEPRFTFNGVLNTQEDAASVLQAIASSMRAQFYTAGGVVMLAQDRPAYNAFERVFGPANVIDGQFDYQSTEARSRVTQLNVAWNDPSQNYDPAVEPVPFPQMMGRFGYRDMGITAMGCTSRAQAIRAGRYFLFSAHREQEIVGFRVAIENADLRPGDLIAIQDPSRAAMEWSGRVVARAANTFTLDRAVPQAPGGTLWLTSGETVAPGARVVSLTITSWASPTEVVTLAGPDVTGLDAGTFWAIAGGTVALQQFRVLSVAEQEGLKWQVTAIKHDEAKYSFVESNILEPETIISGLPRGPLAPPTAPAAADFYSLDPAGSPQAGLQFSWTPSTDPRVMHYVVDAVGPAHVGRHWATVPGTTVTLEQADTGEWTFNVCGVDAIGRKSVQVSLVVNTATVARVPLPPLAFSAAQAVGVSAWLTWQLPDDLSISYWVLKWTPEVVNPLWDAAIVVQSQIPRRLLSIIVPAQDGMFLLKSVSVRGVESATFAQAQIVVSDIRPVAASRIEQPLWEGTKVNCVVDTGELLMVGPTAAEYRAWRERAEPLRTAVPFLERRIRRRRGARALEPLATMEYTTPTLDMTQRAEVIASVLLWGRGVIAADYMINWIPLSSAQPLRRTTSGAWDATVDERYLLADGASWSDWQAAAVNAHVTASMQFRLRGAVFEPATDLRIGRMEESLLLVPFDQTGSAITNAAGVVTVPFNPAYYQRPEVTLYQTSGAPANLIITALSGTAFTVNSYTPGGAAAPTIGFDWTARGFGRIP